MTARAVINKIETKAILNDPLIPRMLKVIIATGERMRKGKIVLMTRKRRKKRRG